MTKKHFLFAVLLGILSLLLIEIGLNLITWAAHRSQPSDPRLLVSAYRGQDWPETFYKEFRQVREDYEPLLGWARREFHGKTIQIDAQGVRKTWNPDSFGNEKPKTVYFFGGSAAWGTGARDEYTIPSFLSKQLNQTQKGFLVTNYSETAYTFLQDIIKLTLLLREGHRPDYVIFYDGMNDVYAAYQAGRVETTQNVEEIREKLSIKPAEQLTRWIQKFLVRYSRIYEGISRLLRLSNPSAKFQEAASGYSPQQLEDLAAGVADSYAKSMALLDTLSKAYGFQYLCFWQPVVFTEARLTEEESRVTPRLDDRALTGLYQNANREINRLAPSHFVNLSDALKDRQETCYLDFCHLSEPCNQIVAEKIFTQFENQFLKKPAGP